MKLKSIIAALMLLSVAQTSLAANKCTEQGEDLNDAECNVVIEMRDSHAKDEIQEYLDAIEGFNLNDPYGGHIDTEATKTHDALSFLNQERMTLIHKIEVIEAEAASQKTQIMIKALASASIGYEYYNFVASKQMPSISVSEIELWKKAFSKRDGLYASECADLCHQFVFDKKAKENGFISTFSPSFVARDLLMRIKKIEDQINFGQRDFNVREEIANIEYDLNALSKADIFDPEYFTRNYQEFQPSLVYAVFIRDYINTLLKAPELNSAQVVGQLDSEKEKLESKQANWDDLMREHQIGELRNRFDRLN